ncbi:hypothetical protein BG452_27600 [Streptomyces sp. CBMA123]|nr:hypothetical protein [Streptomyces sp. CBMA123]
MLTRGGAALVVTRPEWRERLGGLGVDVLPFRGEALDGEALDGAAPAAFVPPEVLPESAASVLFTSGSTGVPKAIVLEHRNIVSYARNQGAPRLRPDDRTGQISSLSFDIFHFEMWTSFEHGARVVVLPAVPDLLAAGFQGELRRRGITAMLVPTMVVNHVVREDRDAFAPLRLLQAGGDVLLPSACRELLAGRFRGELVNVYGPAETTTVATTHTVTPEDAESDAIPIGRPLDGVTVHLLWPDGQPVPPGEVGEIHIGGPGVARGYLDAPGPTGGSFLRDPFAPEPARLYRTGDLGRRRPDGVLEFAGRADDQVKIRGYRVEPGEVARALRRHPQVHEAVVLASGEGADRHLVACLVLDGPVPTGEVRAFAEARLPDHLVPSHFVVLPEIPASEHGKRDLAALREIVARHRARRDGRVAPATGTERFLAGLWESLLATDGVGAQDDFFDLGGHSLLAFRVQKRIKRELGVDVEFRTILGNPVLADLAAAVDAAAADQAGGAGAVR